MPSAASAATCSTAAALRLRVGAAASTPWRPGSSRALVDCSAVTFAVLLPVTPAPIRRRLEHGDPHAAALEQQRGGQAGDPAADHGTSKARSAPGGGCGVVGQRLEPQGLVPWWWASWARIYPVRTALSRGVIGGGAIAAGRHEGRSESARRRCAPGGRRLPA